MTTRLQEAMHAAADIDARDAESWGAEPGAAPIGAIDLETLADAAWRRGIRRRWRARLVAAGASVAALALLVVAVTGGLDLGRRAAPPAGDDGGSQVVGSYPKRIGPSLIPPRELPGAPGPLAGLVEGTIGWPWQDQAFGWLGFDARGHVWRLPHDERSGVYPALSDDGRWLATIPTTESGWEIRDLDTGRITRFPQTRRHETFDGHTHMLYPEGGMQWPMWFSPRGDLMVLANQSIDEGFVDLILRPDGSMTEVRDVPSWGAGWLDDRRYLFMEPVDQSACADSAGGALTLRFVVLDTATSTRTEQRLAIPGARASGADSLFGLGQWTPRLGADRATLWLASDQRSAGANLAMRLSLSPAGRVALANDQPGQPYDANLAGDSGGPPGVIPVGARPAALVGNALVVTDRTRWRAGGGLESWDHPAMLIHPTRHVQMLLVAADAFAGPGTGLATPDNVLGWWWPHLLALAVLLAGVGIGIRRGRRRIPVTQVGAGPAGGGDPGGDGRAGT